MVKRQRENIGGSGNYNINSYVFGRTRQKGKKTCFVLGLILPHSAISRRCPPRYSRVRCFWAKLAPKSLIFLFVDKKFLLFWTVRKKTRASGNKSTHSGKKWTCATHEGWWRCRHIHDLSGWKMARTPNTSHVRHVQCSKNNKFGADLPDAP